MLALPSLLTKFAKSFNSGLLRHKQQQQRKQQQQLLSPQLRSFNVSSTSHHSAKDTDYSDCPPILDDKCIPLIKEKCSPTNPSSKPCSEGSGCPPEPKYPCCRNRSISENPCNKKLQKKRFRSMWDTGPEKRRSPCASPCLCEYKWDLPPECCPKCDVLPRFDELYYEPSDKCRNLQKTWIDCRVRIIPRRICCIEQSPRPYMAHTDRRCPPLCPETACVFEHEKKRMDCINKKSKGCPRVTLPCCRLSRVPPSCSMGRLKKVCCKVQCPFPSFSECQPEELANLKRRPRECRCGDHVAQCDVNTYERRVIKYSLVHY